LNSLHLKIICTKFDIEIGLLVLEKKILKNFQCIFTLSPLSSLGKGVCPLYEQYPNQLHLRMIYDNFGYYEPSSSGEEIENVKV
jgi:hypothetical protein